MDDALFDAEPIEVPANNKFVTAPLAILSCGYLLYELMLRNWKYFIIWMIM